jgi:uncharacterized protein (TIGR02118 family)
MIKVVVLAHKRADMSAEDFHRYWREVHAPLLRRLPGLRRLVINRVLPDPAGGTPACDGIGEDWFDSLEAMRAALGSPEGQAVNADAPNFLDMSKLQFLVVEEEEVALGTEG